MPDLRRQCDILAHRGSRLAAILALAVLAVGTPELRAGKKDEDPSRLTLDRLFGAAELQGQPFGAVRWLSRQTAYTVKAPSEQVKGDSDIVRVDPATGERIVVVSARSLIPAGASSPLAVEDYAWSGTASQLLIYTNSKRVWRKNSRGDYWVFDVGSRELRKLGGQAPASSLMFAHFSPDGRKVAYVRDRNIYVEDVATHQITQLTQTESPNIINGTFDWVYEEEFSLHDGFRWSPDSNWIAFWRLDTTGMDDYLLVNNTAGLYQQLTRFKYPKVGRPNAAVRVGLVSAERRRPATEGFAGLAPGHDGGWLDVPGDPRKHYIARMDWAADSTTVILQQLNRLQNTNTVFLAQPGRVTPVLVERDKAWVDVHDPLDWLDDGKKFTWFSERDGWRRLYAVSRSGKEIKPITPSGVDVIGVAGIDHQHGWLYYYASPDNATQKYLYRVNLDGSAAQRVTPAAQQGTHAYRLSPHGAWAVHSYSTFDTPPVIELVKLPDHQSVRVLADNKKLNEALKALKRPTTEFFRVDIGDGVELDGWCIKPPDFDPARRYPVLFHVYGEPAAQTVLDQWGGMMHLWHMMLAQDGYLVMSIDNRGTPAPRGRDWRRVVYRQVGILAPKEQAAAVKAILKRWEFVDPQRVAVWGWSGGGSMSLNAIFRYPDLYQTAMSVAPVGNQRYYDTIYQERYMGMPDDNAEGYRDGSPITHARKLKGNLLIVHGTADDNVHYANAEAVIDELIAANRQFAMMAYPNRSHSINEGPNTRRHLFGLLTRYLQQNVPAGPQSR